MILQALNELAQREGLVDDPDFEWKPVAHVIHLGAGGRFQGVLRTRIEIPALEGQRRSPPRAKDFRIPRRLPSRSGKNPPPEFMADNPLYVFGVPPRERKVSAETAAARARSFRDYVATCALESGDPGAAAVVAFLDSYRKGYYPSGLTPTELSELPSNDVLAFAYDSDSGALVTDRPAVEEWWRKRRSIPGDATTRTCLVTGRSQLVANKHPKIKSLPGGQTSGTAIVSCNANAFESYGWEANENAPISCAAAEACAAALNRLLAAAPPDPKDSGTPLPRRNLTLGTGQAKSNTVVCYWASHPSADLFLDGISGLFRFEPRAVSEAFHCIWRGQPALVREPAAFYALILSGAQGRAVVRSWIESSVSEVSVQLARHFEDLRIEPVTRPGKDQPLPPVTPLSLLLDSVCPLGKREAPAPLASELFESAIKGTPFRLNLLLRAIERTRVEMGALSSDDKLVNYQACRRLDARVALIKAYLNRHKRYHPETTHYQEILPVLDPSNQGPGYLLGQLMAVLERAQQLAMDANATMVDRYFSSASAAPRSAFVRLLKNSQHHLRKADENKGKVGIALHLKRLIDQIAYRFDPKSNGFPARLNTEQQGLFVLGYHQMRHWLWMNATERAEWDAQWAEAPSAYRWSKQDSPQQSISQ